MNEKTCGTRGTRRAVALAVLAAAALLTAACSSPPTGGGGTAATAESAAYRANIAFAQCMRTHGVPDFPDPGPGTNFTVHGEPVGAAANTPSGKAYLTCQHLLPNGSSSSSSSVTTQELAEGVTLAQCLRSHGEPSFPDPTVVNGHLNFAFTGVNSSQFQTAVSACRSVVPAGVKLP
ncbi:MAG: hypothetical protein ACRDPY_48615 [Streptosporangiaceae bacterium]